MSVLRSARLVAVLSAAGVVVVVVVVGRFIASDVVVRVVVDEGVVEEDDEGVVVSVRRSQPEKTKVPERQRRVIGRVRVIRFSDESP